MDDTFHSKSRTLALDVVKKVENVQQRYHISQAPVFRVTGDNSIAWIGNNLLKSDAYGFRNLDISNSDLSILLNVKLLVVHFTSFLQKVEAAVNFAYEYGIPILWINYKFPPKDKIWFFGGTSKNVSWELICQMAQ